MAFAENSWLKNENGNDMLWNPTENVTEGPFEDFRAGGMHFIYVFRNNVIDENGSLKYYNNPDHRMPAYDYGKFTVEQLQKTSYAGIYDTTVASVFKSCMWVGFPMLAANHTLLETDVKVELRVSKSYQTFGTQTPISDGESLVQGTSYLVNAGPVVYDGKTYNRGDTIYADSTLTFSVTTLDTENVLIPTVNEGLPMYEFSSDGLAPTLNDAETASSVLDEIKVVPNPYYGYSSYEADKLDTRVKVTNLPEKCIVTIYSIDGTLIRQYRKDDPTITSLDWDLKNQANIPIAGGVYLFHIDAYDLGEERVVKWFGALRPIDLDSF